MVFYERLVRGDSSNHCLFFFNSGVELVLQLNLELVLQLNLLLEMLVLKQRATREGLEGIEVLTGPGHRERWRKNTVYAKYFCALFILLCPMMGESH